MNRIVSTEQAPEKEARRLITADEVAAMICCSAKTVYAWAELGYIPSIKLGAGRKAPLRFDSEEIHAWLRFWKEETAKKYNADAGTVAGARKGG
jgi:excisionase family DNA binding protein